MCLSNDIIIVWDRGSNMEEIIMLVFCICLFNLLNKLKVGIVKVY